MKAGPRGQAGRRAKARVGGMPARAFDGYDEAQPSSRSGLSNRKKLLCRRSERSSW
ncbi:hypothetical protein GA0070606_2762 [Micromonospora citrea]|uniref:Uncharacterized protein n=1 Tax=Micromonospora citrea TaxID=47855 RepID=A0A1C6UTQ1_9ACTN|nr:hypothetical protein GA0070606_2762 [Micromonospora citrea]